MSCPGSSFIWNWFCFIVKAKRVPTLGSIINPGHTLNQLSFLSLCYNVTFVTKQRSCGSVLASLFCFLGFSVAHTSFFIPLKYPNWVVIYIHKIGSNLVRLLPAVFSELCRFRYWLQNIYPSEQKQYPLPANLSSTNLLCFSIELPVLDIA